LVPQGVVEFRPVNARCLGCMCLVRGVL